MRFIGGKTNLLDDIGKVIRPLEIDSVIDIFAGSGAVSSYLKQQGYRVIGNDVMYFSYVLSKGLLEINEIPAFNNLEIEEPVSYLNQLTLETAGIDLNECFIYQQYSPHDQIERMYFQNENAIKIDIIRITIENWRREGRINEEEYFYLLALLIAAVPYVSNITGVYGAYLKHWDARTFNPLTLKVPENIVEGEACFYNENCDTLLPRIQADLLYADPPYNKRQYLPNYHVLETIARYDYPEIRGVTGMRDYTNQRSDFCTERGVENAFRRMIENANVRYILISYNNEGLLTTERLSELCREYAINNSFRLTEIDYRRYNNAGTVNRGVREQLYFFEK